MAKPKTKTSEASTDTTNGGGAAAVAQRKPLDAEAYADPSGAVLRSEDAIAKAIEAAREMAISFVEYTKPEVIFDMSNDGATFTILDCITVLINDRDPESARLTGGQKPVHVFQLEENGEGRLQYFVMLGVNPVRDRIASGFYENRLIGVRVTAGPVKMVQTPTTRPNPAWTFATLKGFRITRT